MMKNFIKNITLFAVGLSAALLLSEFIVRTVAPQRVFAGRVRFEPDDYLVFKLAKNFSIVYSLGEFRVTEATNSSGFRDHEIASKGPGEYRFLGLGDSFSFASGVELEQTYFKILEKALRQRTGRRVDVLNCAVPAYSLLQEVRFLTRYGLQFQPDAVILGYYCGNDFTDSYDLFDAEGRPMMGVEDGQLVTLSAGRGDPNGIRYATSWMRGFLAIHSHLYCLIRDRSSDVLVKFGLRKAPEPPDFCATHFNDHTERGWQLDRRLLREAAEFARSNRLRLIVVVLPAIYQVYDDMWSNEVRRLQIDGSLYDLERPDKLVVEACAENDVECVDMLPVLRRNRRNKGLYYRIDTHMTPAGHTVVADSLNTYLLAHPFQMR